MQVHGVSDRKLLVHERHTRSKVEYLEQRRDNHMLTLMFNRTKEEQYLETCNRATRRTDAVLLRTPRAHTNKLTKVPLVRGSNLWNDLPVRIRESKTKLELKNLVRRHRAGLPLDWNEEPADVDDSLIIVH